MRKVKYEADGWLVIKYEGENICFIGASSPLAAKIIAEKLNAEV